MVLIPENKYVTDVCPAVSAILSRIGDKWSVLIVIGFCPAVRAASTRSSAMSPDFPAHADPDAARARTRRVGGAQVFDSVPPKVEYSLTALGRSLQGPVMALANGDCQQIDIHAAQLAFDQRREGAAA